MKLFHLLGATWQLGCREYNPIAVVSIGSVRLHLCQVVLQFSVGLGELGTLAQLKSLRKCYLALVRIIKVLCTWGQWLSTFAYFQYLLVGHQLRNRLILAAFCVHVVYLHWWAHRSLNNYLVVFNLRTHCCVRYLVRFLMKVCLVISGRGVRPVLAVRSLQSIGHTEETLTVRR